MSVIREPETNFPYTLECWPLRDSVDSAGTVDERAKSWMLAVARGFHESDIAEENQPTFVGTAAADGQRAYAAYAEQIRQGSLPRREPVATYASSDGTINVGAGLLPVDMITAVTVRPSHRRRGLLSAMITADLADAKQRGVPLAALTASEASIYGRFGFGEATRSRFVTVDTSLGFALRTAPTGEVELAPTSSAGAVQAELFEAFHATTYGSILRPDHYRLLVAGEGSFDHPEPDRKVRVAVHYASDGQIDGYVSYKHLGYQHKPLTLEIIDLLALNSNSYLALWQFLGGVDLSMAVEWPGAPVSDPLLWALVDSRRYKVTREVDSLWLRPLDVPALLNARKYWADGEITLRVLDSLGCTPGVFTLKVQGGQPSTISHGEDDGPVDLELDVAALGSLYLAGVSARTLHQAGRLPAETAESALELFDDLFRSPVPPVTRTAF
ncbi:GNAT family N-acetyltransferase [Psychromicrobium sp. YIM B11713]|uniref:GNAT family N-acetyltransferase n=1 Tax=Psychromicrobium sp. YIM B11713 TaxID=3145233 RepID=UPI00374F2D8A